MKQAAAIIAIAVTILLHSYLWISLQGTFPNIEEENGIMENYQAMGLLLCVGTWLWCVMRTQSRAERIFFASLALFSVSILVLEVDFRKMDAPTLNKVMNGRIRDIWLGLLWLGATVLFLKNKRPVFKVFLGWLRSRAGVLLLIGGVFWILAAMIDKSLLGEKSLFREELMEVNAALFMLGSALVSLSNQSRKPTPATNIQTVQARSKLS